MSDILGYRQRNQLPDCSTDRIAWLERAKSDKVTDGADYDLDERIQYLKKRLNW